MAPELTDDQVDAESRTTVINIQLIVTGPLSEDHITQVTARAADAVTDVNPGLDVRSVHENHYDLAEALS